MSAGAGDPSRGRILGALRDARRASGGAAPSGDLFGPREPVAPARSGESLAERRGRFIAALKKVGGEAVDLVGAPDLGAALREIAAALLSPEAAGGPAPRAAVDRDPAWARLAARAARPLAIAGALRAAGLDPVEVPAASEGETRAVLAAAALGVTVADLAIADTGTVVQLGRPFRPRSVSLLPTAHLAVLPEDRILGSLEDVLDAAAGDLGGPEGYMTLITGPSRTADIEKVLTIGVHGPGRIAVAIVEAI